MIRVADMRDAPDLRPLWELGLSGFCGAPEPLRGGTFDEFCDRIRKRCVLVWDDMGALLGMVSFDINGDTYVDTGIAVVPEKRRAGIGRELLIWAHEIAMMRGARRCVTIMWNEHKGLEKFYADAGYQPAAQMLVKEIA